MCIYQKISPRFYKCNVSVGSIIEVPKGANEIETLKKHLYRVIFNEVSNLELFFSDCSSYLYGRFVKKQLDRVVSQAKACLNMWAKYDPYQIQYLRNDLNGMISYTDGTDYQMLKEIMRLIKAYQTGQLLPSATVGEQLDLFRS